MGVRPCVTTKLPVLRPWFWNLILLNLAAASCYFIASLGGRVRCTLEDAKCEIASLSNTCGLHMFKQWSNLLSEPVKQGNKVSLCGHSENRGEDAGVPRAPFKQCWFVRSIQGFLFRRVSSTLPSWGPRGARQKPTEFAKEKRERKAPQPKARTESEEEARRERYGQGTWSSRRLYEAHPNHSSPPAPILSYD